MNIHTRGAATSVALATVLSLGACADDAADATPRATPTSTSSPSASSTPSEEVEATTSEPASPQRKTFEVTTPTHTIRTTLDGAERFRIDTAYAGRLHLLGVGGTGAEQVPWADLFLYTPTQVHDPKTQELRPRPADVVEWLSSNPGVRVVLRRTYRVDGAPVHEVNVERDGSMLFAGDRSDDSPGALERYLFRQVDRTWVVGQASTFDGERVLKRRAARDDVLMALVRSARLVPRS